MKILFENISGNSFKLKEHNEMDMNNPEEKREVQIAKGILGSISRIKPFLHTQPNVTSEIDNIFLYAQELLKMHGQ